MRHTKVTVEQLDQPLNFDVGHAEDLSEQFFEYRKFGPHLGLTEEDIREIELNSVYHSNIKLISAAILRKWCEDKQSQATYRALVHVALAIKDETGAEKICQLCAEGQINVD